MTPEMTAEAQKESPSSGFARLLIVDDDLPNQEAILPVLQEHGYEVTFLSSGGQAIDAIKAGAYAMAFVGLSLPDMDGTQVSQQVRAWEAGKAHLPMIALSPAEAPVEPLVLLKKGMDDYILRPYDLRQITRVMRVYAPNALPAAVHTQGQPAADEQSGDEAVLDISSALEDFSGNAEDYKGLLELFLASMPERLDRIRSFYQGQAWVDLARECHNVKSITASLRAQQFSNLANRVEQLCKNGQTDSLGAIMQELESSAESLQVRAEDFFKGTIRTSS